MNREFVLELRHCSGQGLSMSKEPVLADSGRVSEVTARVGADEKVVFPSSVRGDELVVLARRDRQPSAARCKKRYPISTVKGRFG